MDIYFEILNWIRKNTKKMEPNPWTEIKYLEVEEFVTYLQTLKEFKSNEDRS